MRTFASRQLVSNEVGRVHWISLPFQAESVEAAERICKANGWEYDDEIVEVIPVPEWSATSELCKEALELRDREWVGGR